MVAINEVTQSEFARLIGKDRSYVNELIKAGKIVVTGEGRALRVLVAESLKKLIASAARAETAAYYQGILDRRIVGAAPLAKETPPEEPKPQGHMAAAARDAIKGAELAKNEIVHSGAELIRYADIEQGIAHAHDVVLSPLLSTLPDFVAYETFTDVPSAAALIQSYCQELKAGVESALLGAA